MNLIFHEKQEGSLCAQHCLNSLLQGEYFTAVDLAEIASELDKQELNFMYNGGTLSSDYENFLQQPSSNYDDSGFFSIQVLQKALSSFNLELIPYQSQNPIAIAAKNDPTTQQAYICNFKEHWYTIRKFSKLHWFNLNSLFKKPQYVSDTYLSVLLAQLVLDGYSIFIVNGELPLNQSDQNLALIPKEMLIEQYGSNNEENRPRKNSNRTGFYSDNNNDEYDNDIKAAIELSLKHDENEIKNDISYKNAMKSSDNEAQIYEDEELKLAIELSLKNNENINVNIIKPDDKLVEDHIPKIENKEKNVVEEARKDDTKDNANEIRRKRLEYLEKLEKHKDQN